VLENQGLLGIAFFEATAFVILLVLLLLFRKDDDSDSFRKWLAGWVCFTASAFCEVAYLVHYVPALRLAEILARIAALLLLTLSVLQYHAKRPQRAWPILPALVVVLAGVYYVERSGAERFANLTWQTASLGSALCLAAGWITWRGQDARRGHGAQLLAGAFFLSGLHGLDRMFWQRSPIFPLREAFDHLLGVALGIAAAVMVMERGRARTEQLNDKMRRLTLVTAGSTQTSSVKEFLDRVLAHLVESLQGTHGIVRLLEGDGQSAQLVAKSWVGFTPSYLAMHERILITDSWAKRVLMKECQYLRLEDELDAASRQRMTETGVTEMVTLALPGKKGPLGVIAVGSSRGVRFQDDELAYLVNLANLIGLTLQNVRLLEQVTTVQQQWAYTFDSIGDPILVHDPQGRIVQSNQRIGQLLGRESGALVGRAVAELLSKKKAEYDKCPYCEAVAGEGDDPDPWLPGYFLASNSNFADPTGRQLGVVHVLKDITERKRAEEKYRTLVSSIQEGVFISTPGGRFLDFNDALLRMTGFESREQLLSVDIVERFFQNPRDRERLKRLLEEHGSVADFEFEMRRKDGEIRTMLESSIAVRDAAGNVTAYQGFLLDITERKQAEQEIRRRNRELMVLNSIGQTLTESMDLGESLHRTLRQMAELFSLDASSIYLLNDDGKTLRRVAAVGHRSEYARNFPVVTLQAELLQHIRGVHAKFVPAQGLPLPPTFRDAQKKEEIVSSYIVILWSKDRVIGGLSVGSRTPREFSPSDTNLLIAVGSQISSAIERTLLYDEAKQAYENLRRAQEQLLQSEKMAAIGQLISGVAHELNNPLTAILGYSQLLTTSGETGKQGLEFAEKLYKQAQRTHRIVQNLLSFARQHKPERVPVQVNQVLEDTLALRDYDLRVNNIRVHLNLAANLPMTAADPHQLQQVFLNMVNNAVDAILERSADGELWVRTGVAGERLVIEFTDSGTGVQDASRVFDPFYTTKPVGKGTGLGLSICYGIVTEHGGTIRVRNLPTRGACFTIELPYQPAVSAAGQGQDEREQGSVRGARVLLIDHDQSVAEAIAAMLSGRDHRVKLAKNVAAAQDLLGRETFDLIVADLPSTDARGDGSFVEWLCLRQPSLAKRLIWIGTTVPSAGNGAQAKPNGAQVLQKPFKADDLLEAVETVLSGNLQAAPVEG
jgi:two-component system NtrC family sensor kinase